MAPSLQRRTSQIRSFIDAFQRRDSLLKTTQPNFVAIHHTVPLLLLLLVLLFLFRPPALPAVPPLPVLLRLLSTSSTSAGNRLVCAGNRLVGNGRVVGHKMPDVGNFAVAFVFVVIIVLFNAETTTIFRVITRKRLFQEKLHPVFKVISQKILLQFRDENAEEKLRKR